jgi:hypothetical protein
MTEQQEATEEDVMASTPIFARLLSEQADGGIQVTAPVVEPEPDPPAQPAPVDDPLIAPADPAMAGDE